MTQTEALKLALEAIYSDRVLKAAEILEEALAKQEQGEPWGACVSGRVFVGALPEHVRKLSEDEGLPIQWLYTTPQQRKPLTDEQIKEALADMSALQMPFNKLIPAIAKAIEAAHGIKE